MSWVHLGAGDRAGDPEGMLSPEWPDERAAAELGQHPKAVIFFFLLQLIKTKTSKVDILSSYVR